MVADVDVTWRPRNMWISTLFTSAHLTMRGCRGAASFPKGIVFPSSCRSWGWGCSPHPRQDKSFVTRSLVYMHYASRHAYPQYWSESSQWLSPTLYHKLVVIAFWFVHSCFILNVMYVECFTYSSKENGLATSVKTCWYASMTTADLD